MTKPGEIGSAFGRWLLLVLTESNEIGSAREDMLAEWTGESLEKFTVLWYVLIMLSESHFKKHSSSRIPAFSDAVWSQLKDKLGADSSDIEATIRFVLNDKEVSLPNFPVSTMASICTACSKALILDEKLASSDVVLLISKAESAAILEGIIL